VVVAKGLRMSCFLQKAHADCFAGHLAAKKMCDRLHWYYGWKGMQADVQHFRRGCLVCASRKGPGRPL